MSAGTDTSTAIDIAATAPAPSAPAPAAPAPSPELALALAVVAAAEATAAAPPPPQLSPLGTGPYSQEYCRKTCIFILLALSIFVVLIVLFCVIRLAVLVDRV